MWDPLIICLWWAVSADWSEKSRFALRVFLVTWIYGFSKTVKLWGHFIRYPADVVFMPVYITFGYFHTLIKIYGLFTLSEVS